MKGKQAVAAILACMGVFAFTGCFEESVQEEPPKFETLSLADSQYASVRVLSEADARTESGGLLFEGNGAFYTGSFNAVFTGNKEISFGFCRGDPAAYRRFTLTFASASDPSQSFSVIYESSEGDWTGEENGRGRSGAYVKCGDEVRTTRYWQSSDRESAWQANENLNVDEALASPMFGGSGEAEEEFGKTFGSLSLAWTTSNVLEIYVSERNLEFSPRLIAAFDGSAAGLGFDASLGLWGLSRMEISDGYTVSFCSEVFGGNVTEPNAPDVYFSEIVTGVRGQERTYSLAQTTMEQPPFFAAKNTK